MTRRRYRLGAFTSNADLDKFRFVFRKKQDGHTLSVYDGTTLIGKVGALTKSACHTDDSPLAQYRKHANVVSAEILPEYRGRKLYQEMLLRFNKYAKEELGCKGLKSDGFQRSSMANRAWRKLNPRVVPDPSWPDQPLRDDLFLDGLKVPDAYAFRRWFSGSKIVNKKGEPLVVYHGTKEDFDVFDTSGTRRSKSPGAMFTASKKYATNYGRPEYGGKVLAVYLKLQNPFDAKNKAHNREWEANRIGNEGWVQYAQRAGYDGAITMLKEYVVFDPRNIKSATNNSGAFDPSNPSILDGLPKTGRIPLATAKRALNRLGKKAKACKITAAALREGMEIEREHRDITKGRVGQTAKIAAAHICERPDYYKRIKRFVEK